MLYKQHTLSDHGSWPSDALALIQGLHSSTARSLSLSEILDAFSQFVEDDGSSFTELEKQNLRLLPDAIVELSDLLQGIQRRRACGEEHCTLTFTYQLAKIIGLSIHQDASIIGQLRFICPRGFPRSQGVAISLVSCTIRGSERNHEEDFAGEEDGEEGEDFDGGSYDDERSSLEYDDASTSDHSSTLEDYGPWFPDHNPTPRPYEPRLRICPEAHVILSSSTSNIAVLSVLPAADPENIIPLVSSVLYQRRAWGIDLPVVGISLTRDDTVVRVYIGWLDPHTLNSVGLPLVHIAYPSLASPCPGAFDLSDATAAVTFARFVLSLRPHYVRIRECTNNAFTCISWQPEGHSKDISTLPHNGDDSNILGWATHVSKSCEPGEQREEPDAPPNLDLSHNSEQPRGRTMAGRSERQINPPGSARQPSRGSRAKSLSQTRQPRSPSRDRKSRASSKDSKPPDSSVKGKQSAPAKRSLSRVAGRQSRSAKSKLLNTLSWLWARKVVTLSTLGLGNGGADDDKRRTTAGPFGAEVEQMVEVYDHFTELLVPKQWIEPDLSGQTRTRRTAARPTFDFSNVVPTVFPLATRNALCFQLNELPPHLRKKALDEDLSNIVQQRLGHYLFSSASAYHRVLEAASGRDVNEAEARRDWDYLHNHGFVGPDDVASPGNKLERYLLLPRSTLLDSYLDYKSATGCSNDEASKKVLEQYSSIATDDSSLRAAQQVNVASLVTHQNASPEDMQKLTALLRHARISEKAAKSQGHAITDLALTANGLESVLRYHAVEEADKAVCDTVLISQLPGENPEDQRDVLTLLKHLRSTGSDLIGATKSPAASFTAASAPSTQLEQYNKASKRHAEISSCPASRTETDNDAMAKHKPGVGKEILRDDALWIPRLVVENKKFSDPSIARAMNQCRVYCVSSVQFLASLGIHRHVVFGVAADGPQCSVLMAWTDNSGTTFLFDRDVRKFNLTSPIQALQYATFLLRLKRQADRDRAELTDKILTHFRAAQATQLPRAWHKAAQIMEFPEFHTVTADMLPAPELEVEPHEEDEEDDTMTPSEQGTGTTTPGQG